MDEILKRVLTPDETSSDTLRRRLLEQKILEEAELKGAIQNMGCQSQRHNHRKKKFAAVIAAAALTAAMSITAAAAWRYLSAADAADKMGDQTLAERFAKQSTAAADDIGSDTSLPDAAEPEIAGESQSFGGYKVTLLGVLSGEKLSQYQHKAGGSVRSDRTYCAVAIEKEDGTAVDAEHGDFFVSPLIGGLDPTCYNAATLSGGYGEFVENGILYRLLECDNISYFADRDLYLCVTDTLFYDNRLYQYDEADATLSRNEQYQGLNALFSLKLDASLADPAKAQALLDEIGADLNGDTPEAEGSGTAQPMSDAMTWAAQITPDNIGQYCVRLEHTVQTVPVDEDGYAEIEPWSVYEPEPDGYFDKGWGGDGGRIKVDWYFQGKPGLRIDTRSSSGDLASLLITTLTLNEDGTVTFAAWVPKDVSDALGAR